MEAELRERLRRLPGVDAVAAALEGETFPAGPQVVTLVIREEVESLRREILRGKDPGWPEEADAVARVVARSAARRLRALCEASPRNVINATGVLIHTNLGRSPLAATAVDQVTAVARSYSDLEFSLSEGTRGSRQDHVVRLLRLLTGAEDALVVNNNAAAVLLLLAATAADREVVISRGELVEIGGSFRIPDVLAQSGARLREVGTTNRTHLHDYQSAVGPDTGLLLQVHTSNYRVEGFTAAAALEDLVALGKEHGIPVAVDLGSGALMDVAPTGMSPEPLVRDVVAAGPDLVTFSGDKMLGGPQAGIIVGSAERVGKLRSHPLARAVRIDKLLLAALQATLVVHLDPERAAAEIPVLRMLFTPPGEIDRRAGDLAQAVTGAFEGTGVRVSRTEGVSPVGGGSLPGEGVATTLVVLEPGPDRSVAAWERELRLGKPAVLALIREGRLLVDPRTLEQQEQIRLPQFLRQAWDRCGPRS